MTNDRWVAMESVLPDFARMKQLKYKCFDLSDAWQEAVMPAVRDHMKTFKVLLLNVERSMQEGLAASLVLLEQRLTPSEGRNLRPEKLASTVAAQARSCADLAGHTLELELANLSVVTSELPRLEEEAAKSRETLANFETRLASLKSQLSEVSQAIDLFSRPSVFSACRGLIPTDEEIDACLDLITDPKVDKKQLKLVTRKLNSYVDFFEAGSKFNQLVSAHQKLDSKVTDTNAHVLRQEKLTQQAERELVGHQVLAGIVPLKTHWLAEVRKLELEWTRHSEALGTLAGQEALHALEELYTYMQAVRSAYLRAPD